jgi:hypothetical protein
VARQPVMKPPSGGGVLTRKQLRLDDSVQIH